MSQELELYFERGFTLSKIIDLVCGYEDDGDIIEEINSDLEEIDHILKQIDES